MADIQMTAADALKHFAEQDIKVRMPKLDKQGKQVRDAETKRIVTEDVPLTAELIVGVRDLGNKVSITVADGNRYTAAKVAAKVAAKGDSK